MVRVLTVSTYLQDPVSGEIDPELEREAKERYQQELAVNQRV